MVQEITTNKEEQMITDKGFREQFMNRLEVLERVKQLLLIPQMDCMTIGQVTDFFEVNRKTVEKVVERNFNELSSDGMCYKKPADFKNLNPTLCRFKDLEQKCGKLIVQIDDNTTVEIPNRGIRMFPKRAILRMGMLLRDSNVAKEIRTQLLNIEENTSEAVKTEPISEELNLAMNLGRALVSGNNETIIMAVAEYNAFQNRHIKQLENDNKALAKEILTWEDRSKLNAGIRMLAHKTGKYHGVLWNELYKELQYKHKINLKKRGAAPFIQWVKEKEWQKVMSEFSAMCVAYGESPTEMFQKTIPMENLETT